jgi:hypothetical protein
MIWARFAATRANVMSIPETNCRSACGSPLRPEAEANSLRRCAYFRAFVLAVMSLTMSTAAMATDNYVCTSRKRTGFVFSKFTKEWEAISSNSSTESYLLNKEALRWTWRDLPQEHASGLNCTSEVDGNFIYCHGIEDVRIDLRRPRFQVIWPLGYAWGPRAADGIDGPDQPSIEIGECKPQ